MTISPDQLDGVLIFLRGAERLKTVTRSGWTSEGQRESVAEHTWRLCLMAMPLYGGPPDARLAKGLDKLETILQHTQGKNPADFDYAFNLAYGRRFTAGDPLLEALRARLDAETARLAGEPPASS